MNRRVILSVILLVFTLAAARLWWRAPPAPGLLQPIAAKAPDALTILFFGDSGTGHRPQYRVAAGMLSVCQRLGCDLGLMLGDNIYGAAPLTGSDDPRIEVALRAPYAPLAAIEGFVLYAVMGNHDLIAGIDVLRGFARNEPLFQIPGLHFPVPDLPAWIRIYGLHTPPLFEAARLRAAREDGSEYADGVGARESSETDLPSPAGADWQAQLAAVERALCEGGPLSVPGSALAAEPGTNRPWKILFGHHPIHSSAHGVARRLAPRLLPVVRRCGVDLYLSGHAHQQEHIHTADFDQIIQGAAALPRPSRGWFKWAPRSSFLRAELGFGVMRISPFELLVNFFDADGELVYSWRRAR